MSVRVFICLFVCSLVLIECDHGQTSIEPHVLTYNSNNGVAAAATAADNNREFGKLSLCPFSFPILLLFTVIAYSSHEIDAINEHSN